MKVNHEGGTLNRIGRVTSEPATSRMKSDQIPYVEPHNCCDMKAALTVPNKMKGRRPEN